MRDEMAIMVGERNPERIRFARQRLISQRDIAERGGPRDAGRAAAGEGEHVGRLVDAAPAQVQRPQLSVVGEAEAD